MSEGRREPRTAAGRRLFTAIWLDGGAEPMRSHLDWDESAAAILAIEDEASRTLTRGEIRAAFRQQVLEPSRRIEDEAAAPREAPDQRLREALSFIADWAHDCADGDREAQWYGFGDIENRARAALATEGEPTAPRKTPAQEPVVSAKTPETHIHYAADGSHFWYCHESHAVPEPTAPAVRYLRLFPPAPTAPEPRETLEAMRELARSQHLTLSLLVRPNPGPPPHADCEVCAILRAAPESREAGT